MFPLNLKVYPIISWKAAKIQEERDEAAINQIIETGRKYHATESDILNDIMTKFKLSEEEALDLINKYDKQLA